MVLLYFTGRASTKSSDYEAEVRRHASELVAQAIRCTEERVSEVKRKAGNICYFFNYNFLFLEGFISFVYLFLII